MDAEASRSAFDLRVADYVEAHGLLNSGQRVVVGLSGGLDSVVLTRTLVALGYDVVAAHFDHALRPAAEADVALAQRLAADLAVPLALGRMQWDRDPRSNTEARARNARYRFLHEVALQHDAAAVAVGHHRDDQLETVLLNLFRGAGLRGLAGMPPRRPLQADSSTQLVRPLLGVPRAALVVQAQQQGWTWREDPTNADPSFRRNALRHRVVPVLREVFGPSVDANVARAADLVAAYLDAAPLPSIAAYDDARALPLAVLDALPTVLRDDLLLQAVSRWLPDVPRTAATIDTVAALLGAQVGQFVPLGPAGARGQAAVWRERDAVQFFDHDPRLGWDPIDLDAVRGHATSKRTPRGTLTLEVLNAVPPPRVLRSDAPWTVTLDAAAVPPPLTLRPWRAGDRLRPLGMDGHQAVSDLLTNAKVESAARAGWPVVESAGRVVWVVGVRIADDAKVTAMTQRSVRLEWRASPAWRPGGEPEEE